MAAIDNYSPAAASVIRMFAYAFHAAPTADLISHFVAERAEGTTAVQQLDFLFNLAVPGSPFTVYANTSSDRAFLTAFVNHLTYTTDIPEDQKADWVDLLQTELDIAPSRGAMVNLVMTFIDAYAGDDANLLALQAEMIERTEAAAVFGQSGPGAVWDRVGWDQLLAPLEPPPEPSYELTSNVDAADEGTTVTFILKTTHVDAGTTLPYTLTGTGLDASDIVGGQLEGTLTVGQNGEAMLTVTLVEDMTTEGAESLRLTVGDELATREVAVNDTSVGPTYELSVSVDPASEGGSVTFTLTTTLVPAGTTIPFTLSGTVAAADIVGGALDGVFTIDAQGVGTVTIALVADETTEGDELLRLELADDLGAIETTIADTSVTPPHAGPDTVLIADAMSNSNAHAPVNAAEGELKIPTYLTYDLLNQSGSGETRMTIAELLASKPQAGAPLDTTNSSADRGNLPQVSNQSLYTFDLGAQTDRVDYSAESGRIIAVPSFQGAGNTVRVLVNDDATDNDFNDATDRIDTLINVEEIVASRGGGVLDLTNATVDWIVTYSRGYNATTSRDEATDVSLHRIGLSQPISGAQSPLTFLEVRDAGLSADLNVPTAAWTSVQGGDRSEAISYTNHESFDQRFNDLRGGINSVRFSELTRSILVDVAITPWVESSNPADDTNTSGRVVATTRFTNGDGATLLTNATTVTSTHSADNQVSAGMLRLSGTLDAEDAVSFAATPAPKIITFGQQLGSLNTVTVRLVGTLAGHSLELTNFEFLRDNGASDDLYVVDNIAVATQALPRLTDGLGLDHDAIRLSNEAVGSTAAGGTANTINLGALIGVTGFGVDFDVLDITGITSAGLQVIGTSGTDDELVVGALTGLASVTQFESLVLTNASVDKGTSLTLDLNAGQVKAGNTALFTFTGSTLSLGGLAFGSAGQAGYVPAMTSGFNITVVDSTPGAGATVIGSSSSDFITGGLGNDVLRGGAGNDALDGGGPLPGGSFAETWEYTLTGTADAIPAGPNRISITMSIDGTVLTLSEDAVADTAYGDGHGSVPDGASRDVIGAALAALVNANLAAINAGPGSGTLQSASFDPSNGVFTLRFLPGVDANDVVSVVRNGGTGPDIGNFSLSSGTNVQGTSGGIDTFIFEATGALNGSDTIQNFTLGDKLDVTAFAGGPITAASPQINGAIGGALAGVPTTVELIYNKLQGQLSPSDFIAGTFSLADGKRSVVAVTADATGARGDATVSTTQLYFVENGAVPGLGDLSVSLVGIIDGPLELTLAEVFQALT